LEKSLVVPGSVEFFGSKNLCFLVFPSSVQQVNVEKLLRLGRNILEEGEYPVFRVFIAENVEYESFLGDKSVPVDGEPA
jgi:hypothetical protein